MFVSTANGTPKKKGRKKLSSDDDSDASGSDVEFAVQSQATKERVMSRRAAAKPLKYNFSDEESASDSEEELFDNSAVRDEDDKPARIDFSSDSEIEKPPKKMQQSSEDLFDSLIGEYWFTYCFVVASDH